VKWLPVVRDHPPGAYRANLVADAGLYDGVPSAAVGGASLLHGIEKRFEDEI
jgi:hypothetical protein